MSGRDEGIQILGAGVSGLTAAITLSGSFSVRVFDKNAELGEKHSHISAVRNYDGDFIQKIGRMGISLRPSKEVFTVHRYAPSGNASTTFSKEPIYYIFDRGKKQDALEQQLYEQASAQGVEIFFNAKRRKADIIATGPLKANIRGYGKIFEGRVDAISMVYNNDFAPRGYICVLPSKTEFQVMAVSFGKITSEDLKKKFEEATTDVPVLKEIIGERLALREVHGYGNYFRPIGFRNGVYYVGEAGGFQDPSRGFGIWYAILSAYYAAKSIIQKVDYDKKLRALLLEEYRMNLERRKNFNKLTNEDFEKMIGNLGKKINSQKYIERRV